MQRPWLYTTNPFLEAMEHSYIKAAAISTYTTASLYAQKDSSAALGELFNFYQPLDAALTTAFTAWRAQRGTRQGHTQGLKVQLKSLTTHVRDWDFAIQQAHRQGTARHRELFPQGRTPFMRGGQQARIAAVASLIDAIGDEAALQTVKASVQSVLAALEAANTEQKGAKAGVGMHSMALERAVRAAGEGLFAVYGGLLGIYYHTPQRVAAFFQLELIRDCQQRAFTGTIAAGATHLVATRTLGGSALVRVANTGATPLLAYLSAARNALAPATGGLRVDPGSEDTVPATALGNGRYLYILNESSAAAGYYEVKLL